MNDRERAIWKLEQCGYEVRRQAGGERAGWWIVEDKITGRELAAMEELAALVELADLFYEDHWSGRDITPSA